jgi:hypothetical protein
MVGTGTARLMTFFFIAAGVSFESENRVATRPAVCAVASDVPDPEMKPCRGFSYETLHRR